MRITCVSASNIEPARAESASTRACQIAAELLKEIGAPDEFQVETLRLIGSDLKPCAMCGGCFKTFHCKRDPDFNRVLDQLCSSDGFLLVVPHYSLIPSKVVILFEKFEEMVFLNYSHEPASRFGLNGKPVGLIVHGGQTSEALPYFQEALLRPLASLAAASTLRVISVEPDMPGAVFGIQSIQYPPGEVFCRIQHDWQDVRERITPLVRSFQAALQN